MENLWLIVYLIGICLVVYGLYSLCPAVGIVAAGAFLILLGGNGVNGGGGKK